MRKLEKYRKKRVFSKTPEPKGKIGKVGKRIFVVHEHKARKLHWDLRLEDSGVLASWAVTKQPPQEKGIKRLAIKVEDHPLEYAKFSGIISPGNYGAGKVSIWDKGKYELESKLAGKWVIQLHGKKLKGKYVLIKTNYAKNSWIFFKAN